MSFDDPIVVDALEVVGEYFVLVPSHLAPVVVVVPMHAGDSQELAWVELLLLQQLQRHPHSVA